MEALEHKPNRMGVCYGMSCMLEQALLVDQVDLFIRRLTFSKEALSAALQNAEEPTFADITSITDYNEWITVQEENTIKQEKYIEEIKNIIAKKIESLPQESQLDLRAFFDGVALYQEPRLYPEIVPPEQSILVRQSNKLVTELLTPVELEKMGALNSDNNFYLKC